MHIKSLTFKLYFSIIVIMILIIVSCVYSIIMINKTQYYSRETGENWLPSVLQESKMNDGISKYSRRVIGLLSNAIIYSGDEEIKVKDEDIKKLNHYASQIDKILEDYKKMVRNSEEQNLFNDIVEKWKAYDKSSRESVDLSGQGKKVEAIKNVLTKSRKYVADLEEAVQKLGAYNYDGGIKSTQIGSELTSLTSIIMIIIISLSLIISILIFKIIKNTDKKLSIEVQNLKKQSISSIEISSNLNNGFTLLTSSITQQASSIHDTSAAVNQISSMVNKTANNASESSKLSLGVSEKIKYGQLTMDRLVAAMESIQESNNQLQVISEIIGQINLKTAVINDIVSKTELLSLNASIESARAGEYGKGFAVVAEEVGNLAKISGKSAQEIQELIVSSQEQVNKILELTKGRVVDGKKVTVEAQDSFKVIYNDILTMESVAKDISEATREQETGIKQISTAMSNIDNSIQKSQSVINSASVSSKELVEQSDKLKSIAQEIEIIIKGVAHKIDV